MPENTMLNAKFSQHGHLIVQEEMYTQNLCGKTITTKFYFSFMLTLYGANSILGQIFLFSR